MPVLDPGRGRTKTGQLWAYAADDRPWGGLDPPGIAYVYAPDRKAERLFSHLAGFKGILQVDGCNAYPKLAEPGTPELVMLAGKLASDSVPPRLIASLKICSAFKNLEAAAWPPTMSNENVEPAPVHCLANRRPAGAQECLQAHPPI